MKHIKQDLSLMAWVEFSWVDLGVRAKATIKLFRNMFMLHNTLKGKTHAAVCS